MDDQRRDWELRDAKLRQQNEARQELMKRVYQIRADQIEYRLILNHFRAIILMEHIDQSCSLDSKLYFESNLFWNLCVYETENKKTFSEKMKNEKKLKKINASDNAYYKTWAVLRRPNLDEIKVTY